MRGREQWVRTNIQWSKLTLLSPWMGTSRPNHRLVGSVERSCPSHTDSGPAVALGVPTTEITIWSSCRSTDPVADRFPKRGWIVHSACTKDEFFFWLHRIRLDRSGRLLIRPSYRFLYLTDDITVFTCLLSSWTGNMWDAKRGELMFWRRWKKVHNEGHCSHRYPRVLSGQSAIGFVGYCLACRATSSYSSLQYWRSTYVGVSKSNSRSTGMAHRSLLSIIGKYLVFYILSVDC